MHTLQPPFGPFFSPKVLLVKSWIKVLLYGFFSLLLTGFLNSQASEYLDKATVTIISSILETNPSTSTSSLNLILSIHLGTGVSMHAPQDKMSSPVQIELPPSLHLTSTTFQWPPSRIVSFNGLSSQILDGDFKLPITATISHATPLTTLEGNIRVSYCSNDQCSVKTVPFRATRGEPASDSRGTPDIYTWSYMLTILGGAFIGGIFLNFMPCVLPVISMKITNLIAKELPNSTQRNIFCLSSYLGHFCGILTFFSGFLILSTTLEMGGYFLGWGSHFQNIYTLGALIMILLACFLSSWGLITLTVPQWITSFIAKSSQNHRNSVQSKNNNLLKDKKQFWKNYKDGLFMSVLATPCTAPFLGAAIGVSMFLPMGMKVSIFFMVSLGLSLPFGLLLLTHGTLFTWLRPGSWMEILKKILSFGFLGTALWLGWILSLHLFPPSNFKAISEKTSPSETWHPLDLPLLDTLKQNNHTILVNITASWCMTCLANELTTFKDREVTAALVKAGAYKMQGNWSQPSDDITTYLQSFGRIGIPLTVIYGPGCPGGKILSELLSPRSLLNTLNHCKAKVR